MIRLACAAVIGCWLWPTQAVADELDAAWKAFQRAEIAEAEQQTRRLLPSLNKNESLRDAHLLLAGCALLRGQRAAAEAEVVKALAHDPGYEPDPLRLPPDLQRLVREVAARRAPKARREVAKDRATTREEARRPAVDRVAGSARRVTTPIYLAVLPFGVGQFANGDRTKGWVLLGIEGTLAATSIATLVGALSLRGDDGAYSATDVRTARVLNVVYLATAYTAAALMIYGAIDGLVHRQRVRREARTWILPQPAGASLIHRF